MKKLTLAIIILLAIGIGGFLFYREGMLPVNKNDKTPKIFVIQEGEGLNSIIRRLSTEELIRSKVVFYVLVKQMGIEKKIQAGDFRLYPSMDARQLAEELTHGTIDQWVQIIEGLRKEEVAEIISKKFPFTENEFIALAPEGHLFPDTYLIPKNATAHSMVELLTSTFDKHITPDFSKKIAQLGLSQEEAITVASIVEREARTPASKQQVASILLKRIKEGMKLQTDATVQYALGYQADKKTWWKPEVTLDDLEVNSRYNTYTHEGLPPGPICNPGQDSLDAVANADPNTPYLFYISGKDNKMHYAKTYEEHQKNMEKYL